MPCHHCADLIAPAEQNVLHLESCPQVQVACPFADVGCKQTEKVGVEGGRRDASCFALGNACAALHAIVICSQMTRLQLGEHLTQGTGLLQHLQLIACFLKALSTSTDKATIRHRSYSDEKDCVSHISKWEPPLVSEIRHAIGSTHERVVAEGRMPVHNVPRNIRYELERFAAKDIIMLDFWR